ncbi:hypothetical protein MTO96_014117 [Rhipicephalus appendiculatus]
MPKGPLKVAWSDMAAGKRGSPGESSSPDDQGTTLNSAIGARVERLDRENRKLREELSRARLQNEKSAKKIDELQQTLNEILKHMGGGGAPRRSPRPARGVAEQTSAPAEKEVDMFDAEGPIVGSKRKNPSGAPVSDAANNTQESKRPRSSAKKVDVLEEMIDKQADKTERMFEMLLTGLNESDAERNAQHATVSTQLLAVNKRIEDLQRREVQLQQPWRADVPPSVTNVPTIVNRGNNGNAPALERKGCTVRRAPPIPSHDHGYASYA